MSKKQSNDDMTNIDNLPPINQEELSQFVDSFIKNKNNAELVEDIKEGLENKKKMESQISAINNENGSDSRIDKFEKIDVIDEFKDSGFNLNRPPKTHYPLKLLKNIIEYFDTYNQKQETEATRLLKALGYSDSQNEKFHTKLKELTNNRNPRIREKIARMGFFGEILKYDPIAEIRRQTLITTGHYSEFYREREDSFSVIKEMIVQGIDYEFFAEKDPFFAKLVDEQKEVDIVLNELSNQNEETLFYIVRDFSVLLDNLDPDSNKAKQINKTVENIEFFFENQSFLSFK